jgi:hypothetical protein
MPPPAAHLAQAAADATSWFAQYGPIGAFLVITFGVVKVLFDAQTKTLNLERERAAETLDLERKRADRLEQELRASNATILDKVIPVLTAQTQAMGELLERLERR